VLQGRACNVSPVVLELDTLVRGSVSHGGAAATAEAVTTATAAVGGR
jgi:hypothetical protein